MFEFQGNSEESGRNKRELGTLVFVSPLLRLLPMFNNQILKGLLQFLDSTLRVRFIATMSNLNDSE